MHVIGTAGHIDHGKSTLIRTLTGIDPDRLREEKTRGMTIDLGFAWLTLPSGRAVGVVDVPGHQRFVKNMLAGVTGIDVTLFIVAATESWMPQSQEHLDILQLLGVRKGIVVLTKADLVDAEWLEMVIEDVQDRLAGTLLAEAPIVPVSAVSGEGMDELRQLLDEMLADVPPPRDVDRARLWVDRVFSVKGAGTVVTGTLTDGTLTLDEEIEIFPGGLRARVRGIQTHQRQVEKAEPGSRVALNLSGVEREDVSRGAVITRLGLLRESALLRTYLRLLPHSPRELPRETEVKLHLGSAERMARVRLLEQEVLAPGGEGLADVILEHPLAVEVTDPFVIREPGLHATLGGGRIIDPHPLPLPRRRWELRRRGTGGPAASAVVRAVRTGGGIRRREGEPPRSLPLVLWPDAPEANRDIMLELTRARVTSSLEELPFRLVQERWVVSTESLAQDLPLSSKRLQALLTEGAQQGRVIPLPSYWWDAQGWKRWTEVVVQDLGQYHQRYPLRGGEDRETLRSRLGAENRLFDESIQRWVADGLVRTFGSRVALADHEVIYSPEQERQREQLRKLLTDARYEPPALEELRSKHGFEPELLMSLLERGELVTVGKGLVYSRETLHEVRQLVITALQERGEVDVGWLRDALGTTRKYAIPLLEHFDQAGLTRRIGDKRVLAAGAAGRE